jgi:hypothetical protein
MSRICICILTFLFSNSHILKTGEINELESSGIPEEPSTISSGGKI